MKKYLLFTIALFAALAMQSCKDDKTDEPNPGPDPDPTVEYDVDTVSSICEGIYFGDAYLANDEVYTYYLSISDLPVLDGGYTDSEGTYYILRLNTPFEEQIANGTYNDDRGDQQIYGIHHPRGQLQLHRLPQPAVPD